MGSTCYIESHTGDVAVVRVGKEKDGAGYFVWFGEPAHGKLRGTLGPVGGCIRARVLCELRHMGVFTGPGAMALTEMPLGPSSSAKDHMMWSTASLLAL